MLFLSCFAPSVVTAVVAFGDEARTLKFKPETLHENGATIKLLKRLRKPVSSGHIRKYNQCCDGVDFSGLNAELFKDLDMSDLSFVNARSNLTGVSFVNAKLIGSYDFSNAILKNVDFAETDSKVSMAMLESIMLGEKDEISFILNTAYEHGLDLTKDLNNLLAGIILHAQRDLEVSNEQINSVIQQQMTEFDKINNDNNGAKLHRSKRTLDYHGRNGWWNGLTRGIRHGASFALVMAIIGLVLFLSSVFGFSALISAAFAWIGLVATAGSHMFPTFGAVMPATVGGMVGLNAVPHLVVSGGAMCAYITTMTFNLATHFGVSVAYATSMEFGVLPTVIGIVAIPVMGLLGLAAGSLVELMGYAVTRLLHNLLFLCKWTTLCTYEAHPQRVCPGNQKFELNVNGHYLEITKRNELETHVTKTQGFFGRVWYRCNDVEGYIPTNYANTIVATSVVYDGTYARFHIEEAEMKSTICLNAPLVSLQVEVNGVWEPLIQDETYRFSDVSLQSGTHIKWSCGLIIRKLESGYSNTNVDLTVKWRDNTVYWNINEHKYEET
eukprot:Pgem_evm1s18995